MAINLAEKLPAAATIFVHDVVQAASQSFKAATPDRSIVICENAKEVAENAVGLVDRQIPLSLIRMLGCHYNYGP